MFNKWHRALRPFSSVLVEHRALVEGALDRLKDLISDLDTSHDPRANVSKDPKARANHIIDHLASHDPHPNKAFTPWVVRQYKNKHIKLEDGPQVHDDLRDFQKHGHKLPSKDINYYKTVHELRTSLAPHRNTKASGRPYEHPEAKVVHDHGGIKVWHLKTMAANQHTRKCFDNSWCTSHPDSRKNMHNYYSKESPMYLVRTPDGEHHQINFHHQQFRDVQDDAVKPHKWVKTYPGLKDVKAFQKPHVNHLDFLDHKTQIAVLNAAIKSDRLVRQQVASHPEHAGKLVNDPDGLVRQQVASHPEHAGKLVNDPEWLVRGQVASHPEHAGKLVNDPNPYIRELVAIHPEHAGKLVNDPDGRVREMVASHPEHAGKLVNDSIPHVRQQVASHPEHAGKLVNDPNGRVRLRAEQTISRRSN